MDTVQNKESTIISVQEEKLGKYGTYDTHRTNSFKCYGSTKGYNWI